MSLIRLTKAFNFEMAHALHGHDGPCKHIHGHTYELYVTVIGEPGEERNSPKFGMIIDFKDFKALVREAVIKDFDHSLVLHKDFIPESMNLKEKLFGRVLLVHYQPTSENLIQDFAKRIMNRLPDDIRLHSLKLRETLTSSAEWFASDNV